MAGVRAHHPAAIVGFVAAVIVTVLGIWKASFVAGAADAYGYVSEADLIAQGHLSIDQQFVRTLPWPFADWSFAPAGYRPALQRGFIVPTYPAGVPVIMALFERVAGRTAPFYVVPLLGGLAVWLAALLGAEIHDDVTGIAVAVLLATSPIFLVELMAPASDVAATCWWTLALVSALRPTTNSAVTSGLAAAMAVLTRPNLVVLDAAIAVFLAARAIGDSEYRHQSIVRLSAFVATAALGCVIVARMNMVLYGAPLRSGYESLGTLFAWSNARANLAHYPRWLIQTQTPFMAVGLFAPWIVRPNRNRTDIDEIRRVWFLIAWVGVVWGSYLFYRPFGSEEWTYLRFLLPAYPAMVTLAVLTLFDGLARILRDSKRATFIACATCATLAGWQLSRSLVLGAFSARSVERRYVDVGHYVETMLPLNTICIARLHAGSLRYYGNRLTLYYDWLQPRWLDAAVRELTARGYHPVIVVERDEETGFRERFADINTFGRLDWPPSAELKTPVDVRIYDPSERDRYSSGDRIVTRLIEPWKRFR